MKISISLNDGLITRRFTRTTDDARQDMPPLDETKPNELTGKVPFEDNGSYVPAKRPAKKGFKSLPEDLVRETATQAVDGSAEGSDPFTHDSVSKFVKCSPEHQNHLKDIFGDVFNEIFGDKRRVLLVERQNQGEQCSVSRSKSPAAKARSQMLKMVMPELSSAQGEQLMNAMQSHDSETVERIFRQIGKKLANRVKRKK